MNNCIEALDLAKRETVLQRNLQILLIHPPSTELKQSETKIFLFLLLRIRVLFLAPWGTHVTSAL